MRLLSPRELAHALGVSESSLKRWVDAGKIVASRTDGGHRRIALPEAVRFIRETGAPLAHPEVLDLPAMAAAPSDALAADSGLLGCLERGDAIAVRGWLVGRYLAGASIAELSDGPVRSAMHALGELWHHDERGVFIEHRATEACLQALAYLRGTLPERLAGPLALGAAPEDDPYRLPTFLASMVVSEAGLRAINLGPDTPISAMQHAVAEHRPRLVWLSATGKLASPRAAEIARWIAGLPRTIVAVIGGRNAGAIAAVLPSVRHADAMAELAVIARKLAQ
jgi:excisionase family DNA binding protein